MYICFALVGAIKDSRSEGYFALLLP